MSEMTLKGSCLCGEVAFEASGNAMNFFHCHCGRCRKATGSGHASNVLMSPATLRFTRGEDRVRRFKVPDAKFFTNVFCENCGSRLPNYSEERGFAVIVAGSLDDDIDLRPNGRIFTGSAASWSCGGDDIPAFDTYPPRD